MLEKERRILDELVDSMTVYSKDRIEFRLTCGMEINV